MPPVNGARAWLGIGTMGIQPAEFAKIGTAIVLARFLSTLNLKQQNINTVLIANGIIALLQGFLLTIGFLFFGIKLLVGFFTNMYLSL
jgi:rod shape determining protein RodA